MSKKETPKKETQNSEQTPEKVVTRYDRKVQRRKEQKERERRDKQVGTIIGIALLAALVCFVASFPVRSWLTINGTYIQADGEKVSRVEYDYHYAMASNNFINENYYTYLYYFGVDLTGDLSTQMYSSTLTWKDYFDQMAVASIAQNKGLLREAEAAGFTYDVTEDYNEYVENVKRAASEAGVSVKDYVKQLYGAYATESRVKPFIEKILYANAYYEHVAEEKTPSMEEVQEYYEGNKASYDLVDYYLLTVEAQLPTEPTEPADPADETDDADGGEDSEDGDAAYQPSEAEVAAAMVEARKEAEKGKSRIKTEGEMFAGSKRVAVASLLRDWLYDEERKAGDSTIIEDPSGHRYYVVEFENRYLDETLAADVRIVITMEDNGQAILDEWKSGAATEESFADLCDKYNDPQTVALERGLYEALTPGNSSLPVELADWIGDGARKPGDAAVISPESEEYTYVLYYVAPNEPEWVLDIRQTLLGETMSEYLSELVESVDVQDPKGNLNYLKVQEDGSEQPSGGEDAGDGSEQSADGQDAGDSGENAASE